MPVLFVAETRQMKDVKNEIMVQLKGKVKVIDKKDEKKYLAMGYTLAECMELQIEAASPEKIMKDIAALEKMLTKIGGNSSAVKMKKVALERKIAKLEKELEDMDEATKNTNYGVSVQSAPIPVFRVILLIVYLVIALTQLIMLHA